MRVFISYTKTGFRFAEKLEDDLKKQEIGTWIDKKCIEPGKNWAKEVDRSLYQVDYVLGVVTEDYIDSTGGEEAYAKIAEGLNKKDMRFVPLFFVSPKKVKSVLIPAIHGFDFSESYEAGFYELIRFLKGYQGENAKSLLTIVESTESPNPFRRVRAEYFQDDYNLLGLAFAEPEKEKYEMIREPKPILIFGGRGSGKTMILKSLIPDVVLSRLKVETLQEAKKKGIDFLSVYFKLKRGSLLIYDYHPILEMGFFQTGLKKDYGLYRKLTEELRRGQVGNEPVLTAGINAAWTISLNEMNLKILKNTMQTLKRIQEKGFIDISRKTEEEAVTLIARRFGSQEMEIAKTFDDFLNLLDTELRKIEKYVQNLAIPHAIPVVDWCQTGLEFLDAVFEILTNTIPDLKGIRFYLLFDEFENLRPFQQTIINEWIKTAQNFTVKVTSKFEGMYTNMTQQGQPLKMGRTTSHSHLIMTCPTQKEKHNTKSCSCKYVRSF